ncbi:putative DNA ligase I [Aspergillus clavatus NRRL 1]|uniref:DNA ligase n=1 Tax=Aspergillus clavatus (strain ATCC 1007 / CBS 513.65 / DSM 816 / NCTC 3887 / NRRL 1 / QM 1276 / 107) TaxID=344612 RepID=A1CKL7_ASPCL|nr:DNA ligase I, putative [Aspergillus clavatus NRRL 1]EAW09691.1 DNA ligase I, putative [Aspergillus clavatus NRRL 1]
MSSPAKKRKREVPQSNPQPFRSIASFFQGQASKQAEKTLQSIDSAPETVVEDGLSDEALARKLQAEFDKEDAPAGGIGIPNNEPSLPASSSTDNGLEPPRKVPKTHTLSLQSSVGTEDTICSAILFDQSPLTFDSTKCAAELTVHWVAEGGNASYALLTRAFVLANSTTSRIKIVDTLVNLLRVLIEGDPTSVLPAVWLATNSISPPYKEVELGLGGSSISKALKKVYGLNPQGLKTLYDRYGDAGDVAFEAKKRQSFTLMKPKPLTIKGVYQSLRKIATSKGSGSQESKQRIVEKLLQDTRGAEESRYIVRTLVQNLRIGAVKTTMLIALARAFLYSKPEGAEFPVRSQQNLARLKKEELTEVYNNAEEIVKASYARHPNYNDLVTCLLEIGVSDELLLRCGLQLHIPLRPMLGSITRDLSEMLTKLQGRGFSCEYKYDGQRAQVHCDDKGKVSIFSRHLENMTEKYPDLVSLVPQIRGESVSSFILEGEVVAVDNETGELQTFQVLTNRAKKNVDIGGIRINVCLFAFDLMYLNGEPLLDRPFRERRELLRSLFVEIPNQFTWVKSLDATSADSETVLEFFKGALDAKCEGIMVKVLDNVPKANIKQPQGDSTMTDGIANAAGEAPPEKPSKGARRKALLSTYEPDKRLESWLKVKKDYSTSSETLDLIPVAGWHGQGRKAKWWSPILMAVRNPESGSLEAVTKCMSGFTDKFYQANKDKYAEGTPNVISRPAYVEYHGEPDVWFEPQEVWEMAFADITLSPTYTAALGLVSDERGLSLRFPRFLKVRDDKSIDEATTSDYLALLWRKQAERKIEEEQQQPDKAERLGWQEE